MSNPYPDEFREWLRWLEELADVADRRDPADADRAEWLSHRVLDYATIVARAKAEHEGRPLPDKVELVELAATEAELRADGQVRAADGLHSLVELAVVTHAERSQLN